MATADELNEIDSEAKKTVMEGKKTAWLAFTSPMKEEQKELVDLLNSIASQSDNKVFIEKIVADLASVKEPIRKEILVAARKVLRLIVKENGKSQLATWITNYTAKIQPKFSSHLFSQSNSNVLNSKSVAPTSSAVAS